MGYVSSTGEGGSNGVPDMYGLTSGTGTESRTSIRNWEGIEIAVEIYKMIG